MAANREGDGEVLPGAGRFDQLLDRLVAAASADRAARERARQRWLAVQAEADTTLLGVLVRLAERDEAVTVGLAGTSVRGHVIGLAADCALVRTSRDRLLLVALDAIDSVGTDGTTVTDPRPVQPAPATLLGLLDAAAAERAPTTVTMRTGGTIRGRIDAVGADHLRLRDEVSATRWVARSAIAAVTVEL